MISKRLKELVEQRNALLSGMFSQKNESIDGLDEDKLTMDGDVITSININDFEEVTGAAYEGIGQEVDIDGQRYKLGRSIGDMVLVKPIESKEVKESGEDFKKLVNALKKKGVDDPKALAAWIGRRKLGKKAFQKKAEAGRKKAMKESDDDFMTIFVNKEVTDADAMKIDKTYKDLEVGYGSDFVNVYSKDADVIKSIAKSLKMMGYKITEMPEGIREESEILDLDKDQVKDIKKRFSDAELRSKISQMWKSGKSIEDIEKELKVKIDVDKKDLKHSMADGQYTFKPLSEEEDVSEKGDKKKINALAKLKKVDPSHIRYEGNMYVFNDEEYDVLDDKDADEKAMEAIKDAMWNFDTKFLAEMTKLPEDVIEILKEKGEEKSNKAITNLVEKNVKGGMKGFLEAAIKKVGRGWFVSSYDGKEDKVNGLYIYRQN